MRQSNENLNQSASRIASEEEKTKSSGTERYGKPHQ